MGGPQPTPHLSCQLLKQLLQPQVQGNVGGLRGGGSLVVAKRAPTPTRAHPLTMRACKSALITSSISLQLQTGNGETAHPAPGLGAGGVRQGPGPWGPG